MGRSRPKRVLVVDDEASIAESVGDLLSEEGYEVQVAPNGRVGLEKVLSFKPDLVLLDVMMPEVDGFQVLAALQHEPYPRQLPVVVMTAAYAALSRPQRDWSAGFLRKPFEIRHLLSLVEELIGRADNSDKPGSERT